MTYKEEITKGIFIKEESNRFIGSVMVDNEIIECYIPSSSKMSNYINLIGKEVLLKKNKNLKSRTKVSLFAVRYYNKYILLNLGLANKLVYEYLSNKYINKTFFKEKLIKNYKSDLYIEQDRRVIEVKAIIGTKKEVNFPSLYSERSINQLGKIKNLLKEGYNVDYYIISLSPIVNKITFNKEYKEYYNEIKECLMLGMSIYAFNIDFINNNICINKKIKINNLDEALN